MGSSGALPASAVARPPPNPARRPALPRCRRNSTTEAANRKHTMITFNNVNKWYGDYRALTDINAEVKKGEVVVVCGPSGSGKSTLIRTVNRLEDIKSGQLLFDGQNVHAKMSSKSLNRIRSRIGFVFQ